MRDAPLVQLVVTRVREFAREPEAVFWTFGFPILIAAALGIAFRTRGPERVAVAVLDAATSAALAHHGEIDARVYPEAEAMNRLRTGNVSLVVAPGEPGHGPHAYQFRYDPTRSDSRLARALVDDALDAEAGRKRAIDTRSVEITARGSRYIDFLIPGLIGMNLMSGSLWGIGWSVVFARSRKLLKRFAATPMRRRDYLLAQMLSRLLFVVVEVGALVAFGRLLFGVEVRGSWPAVGFLSVLGALSFSGLGLLVASRARTNEAVSGLMNLATMPMFVFSGVFFASSKFPALMQPFIRLLPLTALNDALRAVMIQGAPLASQWSAITVIAVWGGISYVIALRIFRWS